MYIGWCVDRVTVFRILVYSVNNKQRTLLYIISLCIVPSRLQHVWAWWLDRQVMHLSIQLRCYESMAVHAIIRFVHITKGLSFWHRILNVDAVWMELKVLIDMIKSRNTKLKQSYLTYSNHVEFYPISSGWQKHPSFQN